MRRALFGNGALSAVRCPTTRASNLATRPLPDTNVDVAHWSHSKGNSEGNRIWLFSFVYIQHPYACDFRTAPPRSLLLLLAVRDCHSYSCVKTLHSYSCHYPALLYWLAFHSRGKRTNGAFFSASLVQAHAHLMWREETSRPANALSVGWFLASRATVCQKPLLCLSIHFL